MEDDRLTYPEAPYGEGVDTVIAPLSFVDHNGEPLGLEDLYKDSNTQLLLVTTSAEWCTACIKEQPKLEKIYQDYKEMGLEILVVLFEDGDFEPAEVEVAERWRERYDLSFPVVADSASPSTFSPYYDVNLTPMVMLVEVNQMKIKYLTQGFDEEQVLSLITTYLSNGL
jgi:thiol-disulfide isomerase/thioredoxin